MILSTIGPHKHFHERENVRTAAQFISIHCSFILSKEEGFDVSR